MKNILKLSYPASWWRSEWREALPAGNGNIGAAVYGGVHTEIILLTHAELWWQSRTPELPDSSDKLPEVRQLLMKGQPKAADRILSNTLKERGYDPKMACPLPLGDFKIVMPGKQAFTDYSRRLDMETGEITVQWRDGETYFERSLFVSRSMDMVVYEIRKEGTDPIHAEMFLTLHDLANVRRPQLIDFSDLQSSVEATADGGFIFYAVRNEDGTDFGAVARIISRDGDVRCKNGRVEVCGSSRLQVYGKLFVKGKRQEEWNRLKGELAAVTEDYPQLLKQHAEEHGRLYNTMTLDLYAQDREKSNEELLLEAYKGRVPDAMVEKMWAYGRYLLISSSCRGGNPCHLYGLWCGDYDGLWAYNMANENLQMIYWQALSGNMPELLMAVFDYCERLMDDFRTNAKRLYGCRGIYVPAPTAPDSGLMKHLLPHIIHWTGGAGWIAQHYYDYYLYTGDLDFLRERALPFLRETAWFYEDFFIEGEDGYYISCPSNSPENTPENFMDENEKTTVMETTMNATMDFAIAKEVLTHLIEGAALAGMYSEEVEKWRDMLKRIPPYQINEDGAVREWMHPYFKDNYHHRHQSHLYPVFPGAEVTRESNPELFEAFVTTLRKRLVIGLREQTGWSMAHMANCYARMGEAELAVECLDIISRCSVINNFFTLHNDWRDMGLSVNHSWAPFQIDANMGWSAAVQEMLLFSLDDKISILPALPQRWRKGKAGPLLARGCMEVMLEWDQDAGTIRVELVSLKNDRVIDIHLPERIKAVKAFTVDNGKIHHIVLKKLQPVTLECREK